MFSPAIIHLMASSVPLVSYILVNWHTEDLLPRALDSIAAQTFGMCEIILVDNGSPGFNPENYTHYANLEIISNQRNLGFAAANNQALAQATGDMLVLLNCDAYLDGGFARAAWEVLCANDNIGTVVAKILKDDGSWVIDSAGHIMHTDRTPGHIGKGEHDQGQYDLGGFVFGGTAAAIAYRAEMLAEVATSGEVFDSSFFAYYEDVDLDWRANLAGWLAYYEPRCIAYHRGHGSGGRKRYSIRLKAEKNRHLMRLKNDTFAGSFRAIIPLALYEMWHLAKTLLQPWLWPGYLLLLFYLPRACAARIKAGPTRNTSPSKVERMFIARGLQPPIKAEPPVPEALVPGEPTDETVPVAERFPLVSVIVLNYNGLRQTKQCVQSLLDQAYEPIEIIIVDNGSAVDEADLLAMSYPTVRTLSLPRNHGFAGGVNWGLTLAMGSLVALVNNDTVLHFECIRNLVYSQRKTGASAVSGRLVDLDNPEHIPLAMASIDMEMEDESEVTGEPPPLVRPALLESQRNHGVSLSGFIVHDTYGDRSECFYPSGGLCLFKRDSIADMLPELFPHHYFAYHEDLYLGFRLRSQGHSITKEPRAVAIHLAGSTARKLGRSRLRFLQERNRWLNLLGFLPHDILLKLLPLYMLTQLIAPLSLLFRKPAELPGWLGAQLWLLTHPLAILRWRKQCRQETTVPDETWLRELSGSLRGSGRVFNRLALWWCKVKGITCREAHKGVSDE